MKYIFVNKQKGLVNQDLTMYKDINYYLELTKGFKSSFDYFIVKQIDGFNVIDDSDVCLVGYKA